MLIGIVSFYIGGLVGFSLSNLYSLKLEEFFKDTPTIAKLIGIFLLIPRFLLWPYFAIANLIQKPET